MGGRGQAKPKGETGRAMNDASGSSGGGASIEDMRSNLRSRFGIVLDSSVNNLPVANVGAACDGVELVLDDFPEAKSVVTVIDYTGDSYMAQYDPNTQSIHLGRVFSQESYKDFEDDIGDAKGTTAHETGHAVNFWIVSEQSNSRMELADDWNNNRTARAIIAEGCREVQRGQNGRDAFGNRRNFDSIIGETSYYAVSHDRGEALAESVGNYACKGEDAAPLSVAVHGIIKRKHDELTR